MTLLQKPPTRTGMQAGDALLLAAAGSALLVSLVIGEWVPLVVGLVLVWVLFGGRR